MRRYEVMVILDPEVEERSVASTLDSFLGVVRSSGGAVERVDVWGRRKLAYEIDHKADGIYHFITLEAEPATLDELSRILKITDGVMRHLAVRRVEGSRPGPPPPAPAVPEPQYAGNTRSQEEE